MNATSDATPPSEEEGLVDAVLGASRVLVAVAARSLAQVAEEVTLTQYRSLVILCSRGPQSVAALAEAIGVTPPTASRLCERLVKRGLIQRRVDAQDRRAVRLAPTAVGRRLVGEVTERRRAEIATLLQATPPEDRRVVATSLQKLTAAAGEVPEQEWSSGWDL